MTDQVLHVQIDETICQGTGYCARIASHVFKVTDGVGVVIDPHPSEDHATILEEAATVCPTRAITY